MEVKTKKPINEENQKANHTNNNDNNNNKPKT